MAGLLCVAQRVVILLASLYDPFRPAVMNRQNSPAQHKGSGLITGGLMLPDTHTHTRTLILPPVRMAGRTKSRGDTRKFQDNPVILSQ